MFINGGIFKLLRACLFFDPVHPRLHPEWNVEFIKRLLLKRKNLTTVITPFVFHLSFFFLFFFFSFFRYSARPRIIFVLYRVTHTSFGTKAWGYFFLFSGEKMYAQHKLILSFEKQRHAWDRVAGKNKKRKRKKQRTVPVPKEFELMRIARAILPAALECIFEIVTRHFEIHIWTTTWHGILFEFIIVIVPVSYSLKLNF